MANDFQRGIRVYLETSDYGKGIDAMVAKTKQYEDEIARLTEESKKMTAAGQKSGKAWDDNQKKLKQNQEGLKKSTIAEADYRAKLEQTEKVLNNLSGSSYDKLIAVQKRLQKETKGVDRDLDKHKIKLEQLDRVNREVSKANAEMNTSIGSSGSFMSKAANGINKYFNMAMAGIGVLTGVVFSIKTLITSNSELSDSFADVMKTTNLTRSEVEGLYKSFKDLNTRTPRKELLQLASDAGKLGIEGKKNILDFVDAGNQIKVALGEDLGEDAIKNIGKMVGVFDKSTKEIQGIGLKEQMLAVGSAVNTIGQSSSASEEYLVAFAARLGGVSKQAGLGIDDILGYASALDQDMQQVEMSATALQQFIMKVMGEPSKFAKIAGVTVKEFSTLLATDANSAIKLVLKSLNDKGGFQALIPIFKDMGLDGARAVGVLSSLAGSLDKVDESQKLANKSLVDGNSVTKEYNIRNNNLAASMAKLNQNISTWFKNSAITSWLSEMVSGLEKATRASESATKQFDDQSSKVLDLKTRIEPLLTRYDELATKTNKSATENNELKRIIAEVTSVMPGAATAVDKYGNAIAISTGRVREFINAEVARYGVVNKKAIEENKDLLSEIEDQLKRSKKRIDEINKTGTYTTLKINKSTGEYDTIKASQDQIKAEQAKYQKLLQDQIGYKAEIDRLSGATLQKQMNDAEKERKLMDEKAKREKAYYLMSKSELKKLADANDEFAKKVYKERFPVIIISDEDKKKAEEERKKQLQKDLDSVDVWLLQRQTKIKEAKVKNEPEIIIDGNKICIESELQYNEELLNLTVKSLKKKQLLYRKGSKEYLELQGQLDDIKIKKNIETEEALVKSTEDAYKSFSEATDIYYDIELSKLGDKLKSELDDTAKSNDDKLAAQKEYENNVLLLNQATAQRRLQDAKQYLTIIENTNFKSDADRLAALKKANDAVQAAGKDLAQANKSVNDGKLKEEEDYQRKRQALVDKYGLGDNRSIRSQYRKELTELKAALKQKLLTQKEYEEAKKEVQLKAAADYAQQAVNFAGMVSDAVTAYHQVEFDSLNTMKQKELAAAGDNAEKREAIEKDYAQKELDLKKKQSGSDAAIKIAQTIAAGALAVIQAFAQLGPVAGGVAAALIGTATGFQIASIIKQREAIMATTLDSSSSSSGSGAKTSTGARVATAPQAAEGRWTVLGEEDRKLYRNVPYAGVARTGMVTTPTLMGEAGDELVVDNPTLRNIHMNAPWVLDVILNNRVPQRASGNYKAIEGSSSAASNSSAELAIQNNTALLQSNLEAINQMIALLAFLRDNGIDAFVLLSQLEKQQILRDKSLNKGSLK